MHEELARLAELIRARNAVAAEIARAIGRPAQLGHLGEFIASLVFGIRLKESASAKGVDGSFAEGPLAGKTVNVKWYSVHERTLDIRQDALPDYYLVFSGPPCDSVSSRGWMGNWAIERVFLFDARALVKALAARGARIGAATSLRDDDWQGAEIYPEARCRYLSVSKQQRSMLMLFAPGAVGTDPRGRRGNP